MIEVYETKPEDFDTTVQVCGCCVEAEGKILIVQRASHKSAPGSWEVPGGKLELGETVEQCAKRELFEETGLRTDKVFFLSTLYTRVDGSSFIFHIFKTKFDKRPEVSLSAEHQDYAWCASQEAKQFALLIGEEMALKHYFKTVCVGRS